MDESSGMGFWYTMNDQELLAVINSPHAYSPFQRAMSAQEYATRLLDNEARIRNEGDCIH